MESSSGLGILSEDFVSCMNLLSHMTRVLDSLVPFVLSLPQRLLPLAPTSTGLSFFSCHELASCCHPWESVFMSIIHLMIFIRCQRLHRHLHVACSRC